MLFCSDRVSGDSTSGHLRLGGLYLINADLVPCAARALANGFFGGVCPLSTQNYLSRRRRAWSMVIVVVRPDPFLEESISVSNLQKRWKGRAQQKDNRMNFFRTYL